MRVCYAEQMRQIDAIATEKFNIPGIVLMENAANACVKEIKHFDSVTVICGKGNNGGDGLAIARKLLVMGKKVNIYLALGNDFSGDALVNYNILKSMGAVMKAEWDMSELAADLMLSDCTVDAIFGTGFKGEIREPIAEIIELINGSAKYVLCVDVPSGINSDSGEIETISVKADKTVTFAAYKTGMLLYPAADFTGEIVLADISIPDAAFEIEGIDINVMDSCYIKEILPQRYANSHKGDYGKVFIIGGSRTMAGAVCLACEAAFKAGAGIVTACVPEEINNIVPINSVQTMTYPVSFENDMDKIVEKMQDYDVILFGNGIGRDEYVQVLLEKVLKAAKVPVVIDADGLFALAKNPDMIRACNADVILTPHSAEMARLIGKTADEVEKNRFSVSRELALKYGLTLVLKGNHSIITAPDGTQYVNITGNSGMATAGSGDVLAGMTAAFSHTAEDCQKAACLAVYLHAIAGDFAAGRLCEASLTAPDIINAVPHIFPVENKPKV